MAKKLDIGFVDDIQINGLDKVDSFKKHFPAECEGKNEEEIKKLAAKRLKRGKNLDYYNARAKQYESQEKDKLEWNREVSVATTLPLLNELLRRIYAGSSKMSELSTAKELIKELDLIHGIQDKTITVNVNPIAPVVEKEKLKTYDEDGNIVDGDFTEVEND